MLLYWLHSIMPSLKRYVHVIYSDRRNADDRDMDLYFKLEFSHFIMSAV